MMKRQRKRDYQDRKKVKRCMVEFSVEFQRGEGLSNLEEELKRS